MSKLDAIAGIAKKAAAKVVEELPMDKASRMARAKEMGFDTSKKWFHGTGSDIENFDPSLLGSNTTGPSKKLGFHFSSTPELANEYASEVTPAWYKKAYADADRAIDSVGSQRSEAIKKYGRDESKWPTEVVQASRDKTADFITAQEKLERADRKLKTVDLSQGANVIPANLKMKNPLIIDLEGGQIGNEAAQMARDAAASGKYDGVIYKNAYDVPGKFSPGKKHNISDVAVVFDPSQIRSVNAAFDPKKAKSGNILAGLGGAALLGGAAMGSSEARADEPSKGGGRAEMIAAAKAKYRQEMVAQAKAKWAQENQPAPAEPSRTAEQVETGARGFLESASLGLSEPLISGINAAVQTGVDTALSGDLSQLSMQNLKEEYNRDVERRRALKADLQGSDIAGQVVGAFMPGTLAAKAASVGGKLAKAALPQVVGKVPVLGKAAGATAEAAGMALGQEVPQAIVEQASGHREFAEQPNVIEDAKTSGMVGAGLSLAGSAAQGAGKAALGAVSAVAGNVDPATMKKYLDWKRAGGVDRSIPEMKGAVDNAVEFVRQESNGMKADFADSAVQAVDRLKQRVTQGSAEAYDILERTPGVIPADAIKESVAQAKKTVLGPAKVAIGPTTKAAVAQLDALASDVAQLPKQIDLVTAKSILQRLDDSISWSNRAGEFGGVGSNAFKLIRQNLDAIVKTMSPEYAAKMEDVAQAARSLDNIKTQFGTVEQAQRQIPSLLAGKDAAKAQALQYLDKATGSGLGAMLGEVQKREIINVMRPGQTEGFIKRIIGNRSIENRQMLAQLASLSEQDLVKMADDAAMTSLFDREFRAGSQHVNFWTVLGGVGMGATVDDSGLGMGSGAVLGVLTTKYGPRATKMLLDQVARMQGTPTFQKIERMEIPEDLRRELKMGLLRSINTWKDYTPVRIPKEQVVFIQGDIRSSDALTPMQKAKAMDQLARDEGIDPEVMKALMVSEGRAEPRMQVKGNLPDDQGGRSESVQR